MLETESVGGSRNWLLHARYVRGEHAMCLEMADQLQKQCQNAHRYAHFIKALTCLQRAVWAAPLSARAAHDLGLTLLMCKRPTSAFCRLAAAAALQPSQPYTVLLIGVALERLGDSRADAAYVRAMALAPEDPLVRLNLAGRHARAGRLTEAVEEAGVTAELLNREEKADGQLASSLASLLALLRDAGVELSQLPSVPDADTPLPVEPTNEAATPDEERLAPDEV